MAEVDKGTLKLSYKLYPHAPVTIQKLAFIHHTMGVFSTDQETWALRFWPVCLLFFLSPSYIVEWFILCFLFFSMSFKSLVFWPIGLCRCRVRPTLLGYHPPVWLSIVYWSLQLASFTSKITTDYSESVPVKCHTTLETVNDGQMLADSEAPLPYAHRPYKSTDW